MAYRLTQGDFQARFDPLGRLTHLGHPDRIRQQPTCFHLTGPIREGHWTVNCGDRDVFFGLGSQHRGEEYIRVPDEIPHSNEAHQVCITLEESFYGRTYLRLHRQGLEIMNGRVRQADAGQIDLESFALGPREVVVSVEDKKAALPRITLQGAPAKVVLAG